MLETWSLQVLVAVADEGSFSSAAQVLAMTQPAVSRQVAGLERRLGTRLFRRVPRGVRATAAGEVAIARARDVLDRLRALESHMAAFSELGAGTLLISAFASANTVLVPEAVRRFSAAHPAVALRLVPADPDDPLRAVAAGRVDLALVTEWHLVADPQAARTAPAGSALREPEPGVELVALLDEELSVVLPAAHRLAGAARVRLADLRDEVWIDGAFPDCLGPIAPLADALGGPPVIGFTCDDWSGKQALVAAGAGIMLVPTLARSGLRSDLVVRRAVPALPARRLYAAVADVSHRSPSAGAMLELLRGIAAGMRRAPAPV